MKNRRVPRPKIRAESGDHRDEFEKMLSWLWHGDESAVPTLKRHRLVQSYNSDDLSREYHRYLQRRTQNA